MDTRNLFRQLAYLIIFIFLLNFIATKFYWYSALWWFDMFMHFSGGFWLGMVFIWFRSLKGAPISCDFSLIWRAVVWVLLVGIAWELFEYYFINYMAQNRFDLVDTISDLVLDISGGLCAMLYLLVPLKNQRTSSKE